MDDHTIRVLEFEKVLALLADEAAFSIGRELALAVRPETDYVLAFELQGQTAEMRALDQMGVEYGAIDVLPALEPLREVTSEISDWETFPQLYVNGELLGGCDIVEEMFENGELAETLGVEQPASEADPAEAAKVEIWQGKILVVEGDKASWK